ncbi:hypothetical protein PVAG01_02180 [Phlyctema vagabunda]|uniref:Uncharacterized protein n=1 Tax=Phlyctema vagabunda TaxID=108571 RepID=A0ABR4PPY0_9HELO
MDIDEAQSAPNVHTSTSKSTSTSTSTFNDDGDNGNLPSTADYEVFMDHLSPHLQDKQFIEWVLHMAHQPVRRRGTGAGAALDLAAIPFSPLAPPLAEREVRWFLADLAFWRRSFRECERLWKFSGVAGW